MIQDHGHYVIEGPHDFIGWEAVYVAQFKPGVFKIYFYHIDPCGNGSFIIAFCPEEFAPHVQIEDSSS